MSLNNGLIPINLNLKDELETKRIIFIKNEPFKASFANVMSNSFGFGGTNVSLVFSKFDEK